MMRRYDLGDGIVEIKHSDGSDRWLVVKTNHSGYFLTYLFWLFLNANFRFKNQYR